MYGAITGKFFLTGIVIFLCILQIGMTFYRFSQKENSSNNIIPMLIRIIISILIAYLVCKLFW